MLAIIALVVIGFSAFNGAEVSYTGWAIIPTLVVPAIVPLLFFVLWLDVLMAWVFRIETEGAERKRLGRAIKLDLLLVATLTGSWFSYFAALVQ